MYKVVNRLQRYTANCW